MKPTILFSLLLLIFCFPATGCASSWDLAALSKDQKVADFRVTNLYRDAQQRIVGAKLLYIPTAAPVYVMEIDTVPQVLTWVDTPAHSNRGLPHSLEHLLVTKGTAGRYFSLLRTMRLSQSSAATNRDFNFYGLSSGTGMEGFLEQFHALLQALYYPDFTDAEAEREFYHFGIGSDPATRQKVLIEQGSVYDEMLTDQERYRYFFELHKSALGRENPFGFNIGGDPDEMRSVAPNEIRRFHSEHYALGPGTGFVFVIPPTENLRSFLGRISKEFKRLPRATPLPVQRSIQQPKYPIRPSGDTSPHIYPFAAGRKDTPGSVLFGWTPVHATSLVETKLLLLFLRALAHGDRSLLYRSIVDRHTRELDSGATGTDGDVLLYNSPHFPFPLVEVSGIPGNRVSPQQVQSLRALTLAKIHEIAEYPDGSESLRSWNKTVEADVQALERSERVWTRDAPGFGSRELKSDWKDYLEYLDGDPSFIRSISEEQVWQAVKEKLKPEKNLWRGIIEKFGLLALPYASASAPSTDLAEKLQKDRELRIQRKISELEQRYRTNDEQVALSRFDQDESSKTKQIDAVEARVRRPRFTDHPPLTPDDDIHYERLKFAGVPVISTTFSKAPTIDIGFAFNLRRIPRKYYRYLPILPRCLDSLGLREGPRKLSYQDLTIETHEDLYALSMGYESNAVSGRAEFTIRASATSPEEFRRGLTLLRRMMQSNYLDRSNIDRLRDLVAWRLSADASYFRGSQWILNPAYSLRNADDDLYLASSSQFTRAHWDERLKWALHDRVPAQEIVRLGDFSTRVLASLENASKAELSRKLDGLKVDGLQKELVHYWIKNLPDLPDADLVPALHRLSVEVQEDLRTGPDKTIRDIQQLQRIILDRALLSVDITSAPDVLKKIKPNFLQFLNTIPKRPVEARSATDAKAQHSVISNLQRRDSAFRRAFPWYVGLVNPDGVTAGVAFYADFPGYRQLDHASLVKALASRLLSGDGPQSLYMKTREAGLAYVNGIQVNTGLRLLFYYADRSPDVPSLLELVNSSARSISDLHDPLLVDYALRQTFPVPRSMLSFSQRGAAIARDLRDGLQPETIRQFSQAILKLRADPDLLNELKAAGTAAIAPVLSAKEFSEQQRAAKSLFFFAASARDLDEIQQRMAISKLQRVWPSDFWIP